MHKPRLHATRTLRARAARKHKPRIADTAHIDGQGLTIDGTRLPYFIGPDIHVTQHAADLHAVTIALYAHDVTHAKQLPKGASITYTNEG